MSCRKTGVHFPGHALTPRRATGPRGWGLANLRHRGPRFRVRRGGGLLAGGIAAPFVELDHAPRGRRAEPLERREGGVQILLRQAAAGGDLLNSIWGATDGLIEACVETGSAIVVMHNNFLRMCATSYSVCAKRSPTR